MTEDYLARIVKTAKATPRELYEAWLDIDALTQFMIPMPGTTVENVSVDARVDGKFALVMRIGDTAIPIHGEYTQISKYDSLEFTWISPHSGESSVVNVTFKKLSNNETEMTLTHRDLPSQQACENHTAGWTLILEHLAGRFSHSTC